jgi:ribonuclease Z
MKQFEYKNIKVKFQSIGGIESCYILPDLKIAFDIGRCPEDLVDIPNVFLSHGHLDHSAGISYYFSQRSLKNLGPGMVYVPQKILKPIQKITHLWQLIEEFDYKSEFSGIEPGAKIKLTEEISVIVVKANHRVESCGFVVVKETKKLKEEYKTLSGKEIAQLKTSLNLFEIVEKPIFAYSGDSTIEIIRDNPLMASAMVLFMECTYIDEKRSIERARTWGHTHLDEIIENINWFKNEKVVLIHLSRRYSAKYAQSVIQKKLNKSQQEKFIYLE